MSDELIGFGKNDEEIMSEDIDSYRGEEGVTDLLSLCWFFKDDDGNYLMSEDDTPKFRPDRCYYIEGLGYVSYCDYLHEKEGDPKKRVGTYVVKYDTDKSGNLKNPDDPDFEVLPWEFGTDKFRDLKQIHDSFPLTCNDFKSSCDGEQFQKLKFFPTSTEEPHWQKDPSNKKEVLKKVEAMERSNTLSLSREVSEEELRDHYGDLEEVTPDDDSVEDDFDEFTDL
jgi:hypothetical protein